MQVSVESLQGLKRKMTISLPSADLSSKVEERLKKLASTVKMDGFRPGKVPFAHVKKRFEQTVLFEVAEKLVEENLPKAMQLENLSPAGRPDIEPVQLELGKDFSFMATFEVFPEFNINEMTDQKVEQIKSEVADADVDVMIQRLREEHKEWSPVERAIKSGDKAMLDFDGYIDGSPIPNGKAEGFELIIGSNSMIPGFEDALIGKEPGTSFEIEISFPEDYHHKDTAGKKALFKITLHEVSEGTLPELNDEFAAKFNIKEGGIEAFKKDIRGNLEREVAQQVAKLNRERIFNKIVELNPIDLPEALVNMEIERLKHDMFHRIFGEKHHADEKIPDFPRDLFEKDATKRVHTGLIYSEYVKKHELDAAQSDIDAYLDTLAFAYEDAQKFRDWIRNDKERLMEIGEIVLEKTVADKMASFGKIKYVTIPCQDVLSGKIDNKQDNNQEGE